jgi:putative aminopeptidase FrvX
VSANAPGVSPARRPACDQRGITRVEQLRPGLYDALKELSELPGPTGHEDAVQDWIADRWSHFAKVRRTRVDNVIGTVGGSGRRLLIMGHADEICFMVRTVSEEGFVYFWPYYNDARGYPPKWVMPLNQPALILTDDGTVSCFFATTSGHVMMKREQSEARWEWNDWFFDLGLTSRAEVEALGVLPGCRIIWNPKVERYGQSRITGKAMDDRAALAIATIAGEELAGRDDLAYEVVLASTVQEESGLVGAQSIADTLDVDLCLNLDVGLVGDIPGPDSRNFPNKVGAGPAVVFQDASAHYSRKLSNRILKLAKEREIPVQRAIYQNYGSDGAALMRRGTEVALLTYPTRYTHSPVETVDERDLNWLVDLIVAFCTTPDQAT